MCESVIVNGRVNADIVARSALRDEAPPDMAGDCFAALAMTPVDNMPVFGLLLTNTNYIQNTRNVKTCITTFDQLLPPRPVAAMSQCRGFGVEKPSGGTKKPPRRAVAQVRSTRFAPS